jgi:hypothetical protein
MTWLLTVAVVVTRSYWAQFRQGVIKTGTVPRPAAANPEILPLEFSLGDDPFMDC